MKQMTLSEIRSIENESELIEQAVIFALNNESRSIAETKAMRRTIEQRGEKFGFTGTVLNHIVNEIINDLRYEVLKGNR